MTDSQEKVEVTKQECNEENVSKGQKVAKESLDMRIDSDQCKESKVQEHEPKKKRCAS